MEPRVIDLVATLLMHEDDPHKLKALASSEGLTVQELAVCSYAHGMSLLMIAAKYGRIRCCALLLGEYPGGVVAQDRRNYSALHFSCYEGRDETSILLLRAGANPFLANKYGETCAEAARNGGRMDLALVVQSEMTSPRAWASCPISHTTALCNTRARTKDNNCAHLRKISSIYEDSCHCLVSPVRTHATAVSRHPATALYRPPPPSVWYVLEVVSCDNGADQDLVGSLFSLNLLCTDTEVYLGRSSLNTCCLKDLSISKQHATLSFHSDLGFFVRDLGSVHGTFINGEKIPAQCSADVNQTSLNFFIGNGDVLKLGRLSLKLKKNEDSTVSSKSFSPNPAYGSHMLAQIRRLHSLENSKSTVPAAVLFSEQRKFNKWVIEKSTAGFSGAIQETHITEDDTSYLQKKVEESDFGASMLHKMGWEPGKGLGKDRSGMSDFIRVHARAAYVGLGIKNSEAEISVNTVRSISNTAAESGVSYSDRNKIRRITLERYKRVEE